MSRKPQAEEQEFGRCPMCGHHCDLWKRLRDKRWKRGELVRTLKLFHADPDVPAAAGGFAVQNADTSGGKHG